MYNHKSEVAQFRQQQALREQSAQQALTGFAVVANHESINARMEREGRYMLRLIREGREQEVLALLETHAWGAGAIGQSSPESEE